MDLKGIVIEVLDLDHGRKVKQFFTDYNFDTDYWRFNCNKIHNDKFRYYGIDVDGDLGLYDIEDVIKNKLRVETLESLTKPEYPKIMLVSMKGTVWNKRVVFMVKNNKFLAWDMAETLEEAEKTENSKVWAYAKDLPEIIKVQDKDAKKIVADHYNVDVEQIKFILNDSN